MSGKSKKELQVNEQEKRKKRRFWPLLLILLLIALLAAGGRWYLERTGKDFGVFRIIQSACRGCTLFPVSDLFVSENDFY